MSWINVSLFIIIAIVNLVLPYTIHVILKAIFIIAVIAIVVKFGAFIGEIYDPNERLRIWLWIIFVIGVGIVSWLACYFPYWFAGMKL